MPILWPFCPSPQLTETLTWATDVIPARSSEQRFRFTSAPRQRFNIECPMSFRALKRAELLVEAAGGGEWLLPVWPERQRLDCAQGAGSVAVDTTVSDYRAGGYACLWASDEACEVVAVDSLDDDSLDLAGVTTRAYSDALIMPVRIAHNPEGISVDRTVQRIVRVSGEWVVYEGVDLAASGLYPTYRGYPAVTDCPAIGSGNITQQIVRDVDQVDNGLAEPFFDTRSTRLSRTQTLAWMPRTLAELWSLRTFLHSLYGRQKAGWIPDWTRGLTLTDDIAPADAVIRIRAVGLNGVAEAGDLFLKTRAGAISRHQYTSVAVSGDDEVLTLAGTAGVTVARSDVRTLCPMRLCRLAQDRIEIEHQSRGRLRQISSVQVLADEVPPPASPTPSPSPTPTPTPAPSPTPGPTPEPTPSPTPEPSFWAFEGLETEIDPEFEIDVSGGHGTVEWNSDGFVRLTFDEQGVTSLNYPAEAGHSEICVEIKLRRHSVNCSKILKMFSRHSDQKGAVTGPFAASYSGGKMVQTYSDNSNSGDNDCELNLVGNFRGGTSATRVPWFTKVVYQATDTSLLMDYGGVDFVTIRAYEKRNDNNVANGVRKLWIEGALVLHLKDLWNCATTLTDGVHAGVSEVNRALYQAFGDIAICNYANVGGGWYEDVKDFKVAYAEPP